MDGKDGRHPRRKIKAELVAHHREVEMAHRAEVVDFEPGLDQTVDESPRGPGGGPFDVVQIVVRKKTVVRRMIQADENERDGNPGQHWRERAELEREGLQ